MLYRKDIIKTCRLCQRATTVGRLGMLCAKYGAVSADHSCRRFKYDPTKRQPAPKMKFDPSLDFKID